MNGEDDNNKGAPPEEAREEAKTVFAPSPFTSPPPQRPEPAAASTPPASQPEAPAAPQMTPQATSMPASTSFTPLPPRAEPGRIQVGDVLNHMFEVRRFIARGGMGEVFEGVELATEERVAIKVVLPQLAADPNVQQMFRREAKTLTKLAHPALVKYRVMSSEPQLGVLYIVTEYIDSKNLEDALPSLKATPAELIALTRRLADGLRVAHGLGAIHRDISPDNVLLEDGDLAKARVIDFGIAKDLDPTSKTIIGDGFAGKLNFVAPEQLGDFNREVGPWTDVYSLGLVILAIAQGKPVNMGGTLVDAVDKRRQGPDLSGAPDELRPLLEAMLKPNPVDRLRSMDEVIAMIDGGFRPAAAPAAEAKAKAKAAPKPAPVAKPASGPTTADKPATKIDPKLLMIGGGGAGVLLIIVLAVVLMTGKPPAKPEGTGDKAPAVATTSPADTARATLPAVLPTVPCSWLNLDGVQSDGDGVDVSLTGVAANTIRVQQAVGDAMTVKGLSLKSLNTDNVAPMDSTSGACDLLSAYAGIRAAGSSVMSAAQLITEMDVRADGPPNVKLARPVVTFYVDPQTPEIAMYGLETSGAVQNIGLTKAGLSDPAFLKANNITDMGRGQYQFVLNQDVAGWGGLLLIKGQGRIDDSLVAPPPGKRGPTWRQAFDQAAQARGWRSEMLWIKAEDKTPN